jgi:tetratricopeptide (TPR) repeat protein
MSEKIFLKAVKKDSSKCEIYYDFGTLLMKMKKYPEAIKAFEHKIACDTSAGYQFASHLNMAMSLMQLKRFNDATPHIQKSIDLRPDNIQAWTSMAQNLGQLDKTNEEISAYKKVIDIGTSDVNEGKFTAQVCEAYKMIGVRLLIEAVDASKGKEPNKEKYAACLEYLKKALPCNPKDCQMLLWIGQANQNANIKDEAKKYYHKVIDTCPKGKEADTAKEGLKALGEEIK